MATASTVRALASHPVEFLLLVSRSLFICAVISSINRGCNASLNLAVARLHGRRLVRQLVVRAKNQVEAMRAEAVVVRRGMGSEPVFLVVLEATRAIVGDEDNGLSSSSTIRTPAKWSISPA